MPSYCLVPSCSESSSSGSKRIFHVLPNDSDMCTKWLYAIGLGDYADNVKKKRSSYRVCSEHFDDSCYEVKRVLLKTAIPTLQLRFSDQTISSVTSTSSDAAQTSESKPSHAFEVVRAADTGAYELVKTNPVENVVIDEHTLRVEINRRAKLEASTSAPAPRNMEDFLKYSRKFLSAEALKLITCQMLMEKDDKGKYLVKHKLLCLDLYYHNPRAYGFLQQFMSLPSIGTLRNVYLSASSGAVSPRCLRVLELMVAKMNAKDRCCVVGIGSTILKKHVYYDIRNDVFHGLQQVADKQPKRPAKKAYALVVRGLLSKWQIPVAFALFHKSDAPTLRNWIAAVIQTLLFKGFDVRAFVSNQDDAVCKQLAELRKISSDNNSFVIMNKTIYNIFDVRHLVKRLRDCLMSFDMSIAGEGVATWDHILKFYEIEVQMQTKIAAGVTHAHVKPDETQRGSTERAVQLFSKELAAAMRVFIRLKLLDESTLPTVSFIDTVSNLFDLLNSDTIKHDSPYKRAFTGKESQQMLLKKAFAYFRHIKRVSNGVLFEEKIEPIMGFMVTIKSVLQLWKDLSDDGGSHLLTRSLNLECVEDCFREINSHGKIRRNKCDQVTTIEFIRGFNKSFINHLIKNARLNFSKNLISSLSKLHEYLAGKATKDDQLLEQEAGSNALLIGDLEHKISLPHRNAQRFIAGYLMTTALDTHSSCDQLIKYLIPSGTEGNTFVDCPYLGQKSLKLPVDFVLFVVKMEHEFMRVFVQDLRLRGVGARVLAAMAHLAILPCCCFPLLLIKKLFIRIRIYNALKGINEQLKIKDYFEIHTYDI